MTQAASTRLLDEKSVIAPVRKMAKGCSDLRLAVAFWGKGASKMLRLSSAKRGRVICNLESGACNPAEIRKLRASKKFRIKTHAQLHAKLYWSPTGVVVGSSNASANGLVVGADVAKGWREVNVLFDQQDQVRRAGERFDALWKQAKPITKILLDEADLKWRARAKATKVLSVKSKTLFGAYAEDPSIFRDERIFLAIYDSYLSREASAEQKKWRAKKETEQFEDGLLAKSSTLTTYEGWRKMPAGAWLIDCSFINSRRPKFRGIFRVWEGGLLELSESSIQFAYRMRSIVIGDRSFKLSPAEKRSIEKKAATLIRAAHRSRSDLLALGDLVRICRN
ncbi:phospholipase D-like domain-containing protein [Bradyrhizobium sp. CCGUVB1N3]|uniref:phospholipase D family protein n=1 Tax=Bradyrhizobium sp. CCGUVB1N3 TaxID=2949629 RepID=UPI0020B3FF99|nr:phospholipase D-like domain-containing protein [Bradyrhizobium sp. CCGUVB1N3]MCP3471803.1 phospholipase D-like domain-containing protein [Bradyrhizobium sp. CCGUVB1N3]MCP3473585.1 phospholipase D-like domain-containing protein [Bradyrhizobium sp. CCGUVB1N3]